MPFMPDEHQPQATTSGFQPDPVQPHEEAGGIENSTLGKLFKAYTSMKVGRLSGALLGNLVPKEIQETAKEQSPMGYGVGNAMGSGLVNMGIGTGLAAATGGLGAIAPAARIGGAILAHGAKGFATRPEGEDTADNRLYNAKEQGLVGGAAQGVGEALQGGLNASSGALGWLSKVANRMAGNATHEIPEVANESVKAGPELSDMYSHFKDSQNDLASMPAANASKESLGSFLGSMVPNGGAIQSPGPINDPRTQAVLMQVLNSITKK